MSNKQQFNARAIAESSIAKRDSDRAEFQARNDNKHQRDRMRRHGVVLVAVPVSGNRSSK